MNRRDELLESIFENRPHPLKSVCADWLSSSRRFARFCEDYQAKMRKKIRVAAESAIGSDLHLEFETAFLMLREDALTVEYEPEHRQAGRSADFAVTFTTSMRFMVEVTRIHATGSMEHGRMRDRLSDTICDKLGQLKSSSANIVVIGVDAESLTQAELEGTLKTLQQRAERNDKEVVQKHGYKDRSEFFDHYRRLSAVMMRGVPLRSKEGCRFCENTLTKHPLPSKVKTTLIRSHEL